MMEIWKPIPGYEEYYEVSNMGRVKRIKAGVRAQVGHILKATKDGCGYERLRLCISKHHQRTKKVHQLVASAFIGDVQNGYEINHINGIRYDNRAENLEYLTHKENVLDAVKKRNSYSKPGERNPRAKLSANDVIEIRKLVSSCSESQSSIAKRLGVDKSTIWAAVHGDTWSCL